MSTLTWVQQRHLRSYFVESIHDHPSYPIVISEGDSWFSFPVHANIVDHLDELMDRRMSLLRLEDPGDELLHITSGGQFAKLGEYLRLYQPDALLFSGGGNDIVGPELLQFINPRTPPFSLTSVGTLALDERFAAIKTSYEALASLRDSVSPGARIITHSYAHAQPTGKKAYLWGISAGPWIQPYLTERGYETREQYEIVAWLIDRFHETISAVSGLVIIDLRRIIERDDWNDEIHPTRNGFHKAAAAFLAALQEL